MVGRRLQYEVLEQRCLLAVEALPAPQPLEPMGSLLYRSSVEADIQQAGEIDLYTVDLQSGQIVSLIAESDATLQLSLFLVGPDEQLIGSDYCGNGRPERFFADCRRSIKRVRTQLS